MAGVWQRTESTLPTEDAAEHAAQDLAADLVAAGACGLLGHGFDHSLAAPGAEHRVLDRLAKSTAVAFTIACRRCSGLLRHRGDLAREHLGRRVAVDGGVVLGANRAAGADPGAFGVGDRTHATAGGRDQRALD